MQARRKNWQTEAIVRRYAIFVFVLAATGLCAQPDMKTATGSARQNPSGHSNVLPLVEQFKNQVRGIIQNTTIPTPAAIALARSDTYKNDQVTQDFAANSLKDFLENPGRVGMAATKAVPPQGTGIAPATTPTLQAAVQALAGQRGPQNVRWQILH